ncbi:MAG: arylformamidase [Pseudomonadota bacterium]|jgi:arylformamidase
MDRLWDISPPVDAATPVYPSDQPFELRWTSTLGPDCAASVGSITTTTHIGAHADAPLHYDPQGLAVGALALEPFLGHCRVVHAWDRGPRLRWEDLAHALPDSHSIPPRLLVRTYQRQPVSWDPGLSGFAPELLERLADCGVLLVGTDSASVDPADSVALESHQVLRRRGLRVLEGLCLDAVPEGDYELIALPLRLMGADASPVRAVLRAWPRGPEPA